MRGSDSIVKNSERKNVFHNKKNSVFPKNALAISLGESGTIVIFEEEH
jgi:hypothetical protein